MFVLFLLLLFDFTVAMAHESTSMNMFPPFVTHWLVSQQTGQIVALFEPGASVTGV